MAPVFAEVVNDQAHAYFNCASESLRLKETVVLFPVALLISQTPPMSAMRRHIFARPFPSILRSVEFSKENPLPLSCMLMLKREPACASPSGIASVEHGRSR